MIDLRSDTVTCPTPEMLEYMMNTSVGDDVYGEDPTVNQLQERMADIFGMEAGLFCPSGTMCNQIAIRINTQPQDQVICDEQSHIYLYEGGGIAANSMVSVRLVKGDYMRISPEQVEKNINIDNPHFPRTKLVSLENTCNKGGGSYYRIEDVAAISEVCRRHELRLHIDGARLFNALVATGEDPRRYSQYVDTISICLSKGLGAPVGSVLLGSEKSIHHALRVRKMLGGGMRQAGYLAAAGLYALDHHIERLTEDHRRAHVLGSALSGCDWITELMPVHTNIICFKPDPTKVQVDVIGNYLNERGIKFSTFGEGYMRFVTHLQLTDEMVTQVSEALVSFRPVASV